MVITDKLLLILSNTHLVDNICSF